MLKYGRYFLVALLFIVILILFIPLLLLRLRNPNNAVFFAYPWSLLSCRILGVKFRFERSNILEGVRSSIIVGNHQHNHDVIFYPRIVPSNSVAVGKKELKWLPFFGLFFKLTGNIFIDRSNYKKAMESLEEAKKAMLEEGKNIFLMPEGTRSKGKGLGSFKKGAFHMAISAQVPIYPVVLSPYEHLDFNAWRAGTVTSVALNPIPTKGLKKEDVSELTDRVYRQMKAQWDEMLKEDQNIPMRKSEV